MNKRSRHILAIILNIVSFSLLMWGFGYFFSIKKTLEMPAIWLGIMVIAFYSISFFIILSLAAFVSPKASLLKAVGKIEEFWPWMRVSFASIQNFIRLLVVTVFLAFASGERVILIFSAVSGVILLLALFKFVKQGGFNEDPQEK